MKNTLQGINSKSDDEEWLIDLEDRVEHSEQQKEKNDSLRGPTKRRKGKTPI